MLAVLALDIERSVRCPIDASKVDVCVLAQIDFHAVLAIGIHHIQFDNRIVRTGKGIPLLEHLSAARTNGRAFHYSHAAFVGALDDQSAVIWRPPIAVSAAHFLLSDKLGLAPTDRITLFRSDRRWVLTNCAYPQLPVAHEGQIRATRREFGIQLTFLGIGEPRHATIELCQIEIAIQWHEHARSVGIPLVRDDAFEIADTCAFALHLLIFG